MKNPSGESPRDFSVSLLSHCKQCCGRACIRCAAECDAVDLVPLDGGVGFTAAGAAVMETIRTTGNLDKDTEEALKGVLSAYTESFVKAH